MRSDNQIKAEVEKYYADKIKHFGSSARGVDWNSEDSQILRFKQLLKVIDAENSFSLLDFGCGYGALLDYMKLNFTQFNYTGFDIAQEMLEKAKETHKKNREVSWKRVLRDEVFDFTIASGIFNVKQGQPDDTWQQYILGTLHQINNKSTKGFSFNMLTSYSDDSHMKDYLFYANPCFYFDYCKMNFSKDVALLHDYGLYEFSILVKK